ncbi:MULTISPECIES: hypothetical protein [Photorhabdus]|nr:MULTISPECIES: hypothetical protein [Photorhabdus]MDB6366620.1 hypothetical protein [Photorhabdus bodei]
MIGNNRDLKQLDSELNPKASKPAYKLQIDLGVLGVKSSSAQITVHYTPE